MLALFLTAFGYAVSRTRLLPRWTGRSAYVLAGINLAFVPSLFFGNTPADFYAANGWGTTALMGAVLSYWLLAVGISVHRSAGRVAAAGSPAPQHWTLPLARPAPGRRFSRPSPGAACCTA